MRLVDTLAERPIRHLQALYTVVAGLALTLAINNLVDQESRVPVRLSVIPYFIAYLVTLVPFYHGALRHLDVTYLEDRGKEVRSGALMADWGLLFVESCVLLGMAALIQRADIFLYTFTILLGFDIIWSFIAYLAFSPRPRDLRAEHKWAAINLAAVVLLIAAIIFLDSKEGSNGLATWRWSITLTVALVRTIVDYSWCWSYYYPENRPPQRKARVDKERSNADRNS